jgi:hypothetical protein
MGNVNTLLLIGIVWASYKGFQQWLAFKEKELRASPPAVRKPQPEWEIVENPSEGTHFAALGPPAVPTRKPGINKWLFVSLCLLYVIFPLDLVPDFLPVVGWGDDVVAIFLAIQKMMKK